MQFKSFSTRALTYSAVCVALSVVLSNVKLYEMPQGGSVTAFSMLFITLTGYMFGMGIGIMSGVVCGFVNLALGGLIVHPAQLLLDYPIAFGALGLAGLLREKKYGLYLGYLLGVAGRLAFSTASGVLFFAEYTPPGDIPLVYSLGYNMSYMVPEAIATLLIFAVPQVRLVIDRLRSVTK